MISMSRELMMELSTSLTSPVMRAMMSPRRSWEKKPSGRERIFLYSCILMSLSTPVRMGIMTADDPK